MITVSKDKTGDFSSIQDAVDSVVKTPETIFIKNGIYKERVEVKQSGITFIGESSDKTILTNDYYANMVMEDGSKCGTFRSYTFFVFASDFHAYNITFENSAGSGELVGQAVAVYAEGDNISFKNCRMLGEQDTLFTGPLPEKEKIKGGFTGPTEYAERIPGHQLFEDCYIAGNIDFIFGSATCYFKNCHLFAVNRNAEINAYYTAPSTYEGQKYGYVFESCLFDGNCPDGTCMLSRPWRGYAKTAFLNCNFSANVNLYGYNDWEKPESHNPELHAEYNCFGPGNAPEKRPSYIKQLSEKEAALYTKDLVLNS